MRVLTLDRLQGWTQGASLVGLAVLAWAVFVPSGVFWVPVLAAGLVGSAVGTAALVHSRSPPSLAQVLASAEAEPVVGPRRIGRRP